LTSINVHQKWRCAFSTASTKRHAPSLRTFCDRERCGFLPAQGACHSPSLSHDPRLPTLRRYLLQLSSHLSGSPSVPADRPSKTPAHRRSDHWVRPRRQSLGRVGRYSDTGTRKMNDSPRNENASIVRLTVFALPAVGRAPSRT